MRSFAGYRKSVLAPIGRHTRRFARILWSRAVLWPLAAALYLGVLDAALWAGGAFYYKRDTTVPEGSIVYSALKVTRGAALYNDFSSPPYATTPYPPLYYMVSGGIAKLFGGTVEACYVSGRVVSLVSAIACLVMVALLSRRIGTPPTWAVGGVLVAMTVTALRPWVSTCRPDVFSVALALGGVYCMLAHPTARGALVASLLLLLGLCTKQTVVSAPIAMGLMLFWRGSWRRLAILCTTIGLGGAAIYMITDWANHGRFTQNVVGANVAPLKWDQPWDQFLNCYLQGAGIPLFFAVLGMIGVGRKWSSRALPEWAPDAYPMAVYLSISLTLAVAMSLKAGADANYFIEPGLVTAVFAGNGLRHLTVFMRRNTIAQLIGLACLLVVFDAVRSRFANVFLNDTVYRIQRDPKVVLHDLEKMPGDILFGDSGLALHSGRRILLLDKFNASYLSDEGLVDLGPLVAKLENREIAAVVTDVGPYSNVRGQLWWPRDIASAVFRNYVFDRVIHENIFIYVPAGPGRDVPGPRVAGPAGGPAGMRP